VSERLAFVLPCHQRHDLAAICLRQLRRTCDALTATGLEATAVLVSDETYFADLAAELGFDHVRQANKPLGRKWNDGYEHAGRQLGADYLVPIGSDDVIDWQIITGHLPAIGTVRASRLCALLSPDGTRLRPLEILYPGGDGIRIFRADSLEHLGYRPALDSRDRALDTSIVLRWIDTFGSQPTFVYHDLHQLQIVGIKSSYGREQQLNGYTDCADHGADEYDDALALIAVHYPAELVDDLAGFYESRVLARLLA
jgi:hypothetical protein